MQNEDSELVVEDKIRTDHNRKKLFKQNIQNKFINKQNLNLNRSVLEIEKAILCNLVSSITPIHFIIGND